MYFKMSGTLCVALALVSVPANAFDFIYLDAANQYVGTVAVNSYLNADCESDEDNELSATGEKGEKEERHERCAPEKNAGKKPPAPMPDSER